MAHLEVCQNTMYTIPVIQLENEAAAEAIESAASSTGFAWNGLAIIQFSAQPVIAQCMPMSNTTQSQLILCNNNQSSCQRMNQCREYQSFPPPVSQSVIESVTENIESEASSSGSSTGSSTGSLMGSSSESSSRDFASAILPSFKMAVPPSLDAKSAIFTPALQRNAHNYRPRDTTIHRRTGQHPFGGSNPVFPEWSRTNVLSFARINVISPRIGGSTALLTPPPSRTPMAPLNQHAHVIANAVPPLH